MKHFWIILLILFSLIKSISSHAEGTKQLMPTSTDVGMVALDPTYGNFALYGSPTLERLNIRICNLGEIIYLGFNQSNNDVVFRLKDPSGNVVLGQMPVPITGAGKINTYAQAVAGPSAIAGPAGYPAISYTPAMIGDYYIEFQLPAGNPRREFTFFDITVGSSTNTVIPGRLWSAAWMLSTGNYGVPLKSSVFIYSSDNYVYSLGFNGMAPYIFVINANSTGCKNLGTPITDRQSTAANNTYPEYPVFLNNPDPACFPTGTIGTVSSIPTITGCSTNYCINVNATKSGKVDVLMDLDGVPGYQPSSPDRLITAAVVAGINCISWDGKDGLGNTVGSGSIKIATVFKSNLVNLPLYDIEQNPNGYIVNCVRPSRLAPKLFWDDVNISGGTTNLNGAASPAHTWNWVCCTNSPADYGNGNTINTWWNADSTSSFTSVIIPTSAISANAETRPTGGAGGKKDTMICGNSPSYNLSGQVINSGGGLWSSTGTGTFSPGNTSLNGTYYITSADRAAGLVRLILTTTGNGSCTAAKDTLILRFQPTPTSNAGISVTVCANNPIAVLNGTVVNAVGGLWTSSGSGIFSPSVTSLSGNYIPSSTDIASGSVILTLVTTGNNKCTPGISTKLITIQAAPNVNAGPPQTVCANNSVILAGTVTGATSQTWSGGTGTFTPNNTTLNATYIPTAAEKTAGNVNLILSANRAGCNVVQSNVNITIQSSPTSNAGPNQSVCENNPNVTLAGTGTNGTSYTWSAGGGTFSPNNTTFNAIYLPTPSDLASGSFPITLTANRAGCISVTSSMTVTVTAAPTVNAGLDGNACANNPAYILSGTSSTGSGSWTGSGGAFIPNANTLNATYIPSAAEISAQVAMLILTSANNVNCIAVNDTMLIVISNSPIANAGLDRSACSNNPSIVLGGSASNATSTVWTGGSGTFTPNNKTLTATYIPSSAEIITGNVKLSLTASKATCNSATDSMVITFTPAPIINAGVDQTVCANITSIILNGSFTNAPSGIWSTSGSGIFSPNANTLNATYVPTVADKTAGNITLTLMTSGMAPCNTVSDQMIITLTSVPTINAGPDQIVCTNTFPIQLNGSGSTAKWSGGTGTFNNLYILNPTYTPNTAEITSGTTTLTLTTVPSGACPVVSDVVTISILPVPTANAGTDQSILNSVSTVNITGLVTIATGGTWSSTGTGSFANASALNTTYTLSVADITSGSITLILTTTGNNGCIAVNDQMKIMVQQPPKVDAGVNLSVDEGTQSISIKGTVSGAKGGKWSGGTGTFSPNDTSLTVTYIPSRTDFDAGFVTLRLSSTGNNGYAAVSDSIRINFIKELAAPSGISPNNDGKNDFFVIKGIGAHPLNDLWVYSRDGFELAHFVNYNNEWDGHSAEGKELPNGTYYFVFKTKDEITLKGYVEIRR